MGAINTSNVADAIVKLVAARIPDALVGNLQMAQLVYRDFDAAIQNGGDVVNVPLPPVLTASNLAEGGTVTAQNPSLGSAQVALNCHSHVTFQVPDITRALANINVVDTYMTPALVALAESIETNLFSLYPNFTYNAAVGGAVPISEAIVDEAETKLFSAKVPAALPKYLGVSGATYSALRQIGRFSEVDTIGSGDSIVTGRIMKVKDFNVFRSQYVQKPSTINYGLGFVREAIALVSRRLPMPPPGTGAVATYVEFGGYGFRVIMSYAPNTLAVQITIDCLYGIGVLRNQFGIQVNSNE